MDSINYPIPNLDSREGKKQQEGGCAIAAGEFHRSSQPVSGEMATA